ncbi:aldo/keto reductase, partial [Rhizobium phaseoli]
MKTRRIGKTRLEVTEISFGAAALGGLYRACPREQAMGTLQAAWNSGIRYFDVAPWYGLGLAERRVGDFLRDQPDGSYVLSTKVGRLLRPVPTGTVPDYSYVDPLSFDADYDYSYDGIMRSVACPYARIGANRYAMLMVPDNGGYTLGPPTKRFYRN